jgi:hypothetical protein
MSNVQASQGMKAFLIAKETLIFHLKQCETNFTPCIFALQMGFLKKQGLFTSYNFQQAW